MFVEMNNEELMMTDGGMCLALGVLCAGGIVAGTALVVGGSVVLAGKALQKFSDWIG